MPTNGSAEPGDANHKHWKYYFLRETFKPEDRPTLETSEGGRTQYRLARKKWDREEGGRFQTWVYVAGLLIVVGIWALLVFH